MRQLLFILTLLEALTFFLASSLHSGTEILSLHEPRIVPAIIVECLCGLFLLIGALLIMSRSANAWEITLAAHIFSVTGVLLGIWALAMGRGPTTELNYYYHRSILLLLIITVAILVKLSGRNALKREGS